MWRPRETEKRTELISVRLTSEEKAAVEWLAEALSAEHGGRYIAADVTRLALGEYYERRKASSAKSDTTKRRKR